MGWALQEDKRQGSLGALGVGTVDSSGAEGGSELTQFPPLPLAHFIDGGKQGPEKCRDWPNVAQPRSSSPRFTAGETGVQKIRKMILPQTAMRVSSPTSPFCRRGHGGRQRTRTSPFSGPVQTRRSERPGPTGTPCPFQRPLQRPLPPEESVWLCLHQLPSLSWLPASLIGSFGDATVVAGKGTGDSTTHPRAPPGTATICFRAEEPQGLLGLYPDAQGGQVPFPPWLP